MNVPGFSAEASVYKPLQHYTTFFIPALGSPHLALPALPKNGGGNGNLCTPRCGRCVSDVGSRTGCSQPCLKANCEYYDIPCRGCTDPCSDGQFCGAFCKDTSNDPNNCGACGHVCTGGTSCNNGVCTCPGGLTNCGGVCKDTSSDPNNCGHCGNVCPGTVCQNGKCVCEAPTTNCNGVCTNLQTDPNHCGSCNLSCSNLFGPDSCCRSGSCISPGSVCGGVCTDTTSDPNNCGRCANVCSKPNSTCCSSKCTDLSTDQFNCGSCGVGCAQCCYKGACGVTSLCPGLGLGCCPTGLPKCHVFLGRSICLPF